MLFQPVPSAAGLASPVGGTVIGRVEEDRVNPGGERGMVEQELETEDAGSAVAAVTLVAIALT